jgi:hypothetical protein
MFLADEPAGRAAGLDPKRSLPDEFTRYARSTSACRTGLPPAQNAWFDSRLETISTGRNWRTLLKLIELASG